MGISQSVPKINIKSYFHSISDKNFMLENKEKDDLYFTYDTEDESSGYIGYEEFELDFYYDYFVQNQYIFLKNKIKRTEKDKYYKGRKIVLDRINKFKNLKIKYMLNILSMDGVLPPNEFIKNSNKFFVWEMKDEEEATNFCYYIYSNYKDRNFIKNKTDLLLKLSLEELEVLSKCYEMLETFNDDEMFFYKKIHMDIYLKLLSETPLMKPIDDKIGFLMKKIATEEYDQPKESANISGVLSIYHYKSDFYKKNIYIVGERHENSLSNICPNIINNFKFKGQEYIYDPIFKVYLNFTKVVNYWNTNKNNIREEIKNDSSNYDFNFFINNKNYNENDFYNFIIKKYIIYFDGDENLEVKKILNIIINYNNYDKHIWVYIKNILDRGDLFVDILFEDWYDSINTRNIVSEMVKDRDDFIKINLGITSFTYMGLDDCIEYNIENIDKKYEMKLNSSCLNYRIDYIDFRRFYDKYLNNSYNSEIKNPKFFQNLNGLIFLISKYHQIINYENVEFICDIFIYEQLISEPSHKILLSFFENDDSFYNIFTNHYYSDSFLQEEISKSYLSNEINNYFEETLIKKIKITKEEHKITKKDYIDFYNEIKDLVNNHREGDEYEIMNTIYDDLYDIVIELSSLIADVYALARIFKQMKHKEYEHGPDEIRNCILFMGNDHTKDLENFFDKKIWKTEMIVENGVCQKLKGNQPWFKEK